jgi:BirA family biotin operon repressor/biotin-[acetyl-CoA-carboxylase] ligase
MASAAEEPSVLRLLKGTGVVSGSRLAEALGLSRAAVHKQVQKLRSRGYQIVGTNRLGYRLGPSPEVLAPEAFSHGLGRPFHHFPVLSSTQEEAKKQVLQGAPHGALVLADRQTSGRGRLGRRWRSPKGGLWFSLVLRPPLRPAQVPALALVAALDWAMVIRQTTGLTARVKWPNDVWINDKKAAGILTEMASELDRVHWVILGVGLNVNNRAPGKTLVPAVSLKALAGKPVPRQELLSRWLGAFAVSYQRFLEQGFSPFRSLYQNHSLLQGREVVCETAQGLWQGRVQGIDEEGRLLVQGVEGLRAFGEGDVSLTKSFLNPKKK